MQATARDRLLIMAEILGQFGLVWHRIASALHSTDAALAADQWEEVVQTIEAAAQGCQRLLDVAARQNPVGKEYTEADMPFAGAFSQCMMLLCDAAQNLVHVLPIDPMSLKIQRWQSAHDLLVSSAVSARLLALSIEAAKNPLGDKTPSPNDAPPASCVPAADAD